eukprot:TRINITY_DN30195_c0_g1_i1.p1 TRINITY_DN30195_c0_g1~~TRINITY_DN30195_c0_g1_i1.p1  ORF type:complete len:321 (+),score=65.80 TRINITY_DN30195_c0_g1_i1:112-1074(+)
MFAAARGARVPEAKSPRRSKRDHGKGFRLTRKKREAARKIWEWWTVKRCRLVIRRQLHRRLAFRIQAAWWRHQRVKRIAARERSIRMKWYVLFRALDALRRLLGPQRLRLGVCHALYGAEGWAAVQRAQHRALQEASNADEVEMACIDESLCRQRVAREQRAEYLILCEHARALGAPPVHLPPMPPAAPKGAVVARGTRAIPPPAAPAVGGFGFQPTPPATPPAVTRGPAGARPAVSAARLHYWAFFLANLPQTLLAAEAAVEALLLREVASRAYVESDQLRAAPYLDLKRHLRPVPTLLSVNAGLCGKYRRAATPLNHR